MDAISHYSIDRLLGSGGSSIVYRAVDTQTGDVVALKVLRPALLSEPGYLDRFHREARIATELRSEHIVRVIESGRDGERYFLAMDFIDGPSLSQVLSERRLALDQVLNIARQVCVALHEASRYGIVHRDIKPQNIMIAADGVVKVADFGVARMEGESGITTDGLYLGTPEYMSPDHVKGRVDVRSDIYSLGIVMYQMVTGQLPFAGPPLAVIDMQTRVPAPRVRERTPDVPEWLDETIARCLEKDPSRRFQSPRDLLATLQRKEIAPAAPPLVYSPPTPRRPGANDRTEGAHIAQGRSLLTAFALIGLALVIAVVMLSLARSGDSAGAMVAGVFGIALLTSVAVVFRARPGRVVTPFLIELEGGQLVALQRGANVVGRSHGTQVFLPSPDASRRHAVILVEDAMVSLRDLGSENGTFVNGMRIRSAAIKPGDEIRFGTTRVTLLVREETR